MNKENWKKDKNKWNEWTWKAKKEGMNNMK